MQRSQLKDSPNQGVGRSGSATIALQIHARRDLEGSSRDPSSHRVQTWARTKTSRRASCRDQAEAGEEGEKEEAEMRETV